MPYSRFNGSVLDSAGNVVDGCSIEVERAISGTPLAALKSNRTGSSALTNPFVAASGADIGFYVLPGKYNVRAYLGPSGAPTFERIWPDVEIGNAGTSADYSIAPEDFGAVSGEDCTQALQDMAAWINAYGVDGVTINSEPGAEYRIWPDGGATPSTILNLVGINGLTWNFNGSKIITDYEFAEAFGVFFFNGGCRNITLNDPWLVEESVSVASATVGTRFITIYDGTAPWSENFLITNARQSGGSAFLVVASQPSLGGGYIRNITLLNADLENIYYGLVFQATGDNFFARGVRYSNLGRAYFPYNVSHHDVELIGDGGALDQVLMKVYAYPKMLRERRQTANMRVHLRNSPPSAATGGELSQLQIEQAVAPMTVSAIASNGSGGSRLTVNSTTDATTGEEWFFNVTGTTGINGSRALTVIDATHVDVAVAFVGTGTGYASVPAAAKDIHLHFDFVNDPNEDGCPVFSTSKIPFGGGFADTSLRGYEIANLKLSGFVSGYDYAAVAAVRMFSDAAQGTWVGENIHNVRVEDFTFEGASAALNFNCAVVTNMLFQNVKGSTGTTWTFTTPREALFINVDVPSYKLGFSFGVDDPYTTIKSKFTAFNDTGNSMLVLGQAPSRGGSVFWAYNATAASASLQMATIGYSNPIYIDGSSVIINDNSNGTTLIHNGGDAPVGTGAYVLKSYADGLIAAADAMVYKGATDCSGNPNYPAGNAGDTYRVSVAGKIGGASGIVVEVGDIFICNTDGTASGNQATVGASWNVIQTNVDGAVTLTGTQTLTNKTLTNAIVGTQTAGDNSTKAASTAYADNAALPAAVAITPNWLNTGTANTLGNGTISGTVTQIASKLRFVTINLTWGSTTSAGSGIQYFTLPAPYNNNLSGGFFTTTLYQDTGGVGNLSGLMLGSLGGLQLYLYSSSGAAISATVPFTWATGDVIQVSFLYPHA